ncbi:MAG: putative periplasmic spermidine/putrescine-binding protein [Acidimicrobiaceae bacterium]|nr:MAG: putative periplasmic spermidine/putrescine-binding protein [Acidimicrobiaceae bacterium]
MSREPVRILAPLGFANRLTRRQLIFGAAGAAGATLLISACGDDSSDPATSDATGATGAPIKASGTVNLYTWGEYHDPDLIAEASDTIGVDMAVQFYAKLDKSKLPNWGNIDPVYLGREWDPANEWAVPRDWGSTGFLYDSSVIQRDLVTWNDYFDAAANEASGQTSALDTSDNILGPYFWANGISWNTEKQEDLDAAEAFLVNEFAPHIKAFDSYPSTKIAEGAYSLSAAWNGDARQAYIRIADAGGDPEPWKWVLGAPMTEIWMDHYAIPGDAKNPDGAYAWINWMLEKPIAFRDLSYIGYNMTVAGTRELAEAAKLERLDMIYFTEEQLAGMEGGIVNAAQNRKVEIYNKVKAAAGG